MSTDTSPTINPAAPAAPATVEQKRYKLFIARFPYGGLEESDLADWLVTNVCAMKQHPLCDPEIQSQKFNDTPITMTRNRAIEIARLCGADFLLMLDSDNAPDMCLPSNPNRSRLLESPQMVPFLPTAFTFLVKQREAGTPAVIAAPYCGPSPEQCVYVFQWCTKSSGINPLISLEMIPREEAAKLRGIREVAALPTGVILFDMQAFDKVEPPYTFYEWSDKRELQKASTEDVACTRDLSLAGVKQYCHWSAWAGHWKRELVGPPALLSPDAVSEKYKKLVIEEYEAKKAADKTGGMQPVVVESGGIFKSGDFAVPPQNGHADTNGHACPTVNGQGNDGPTVEMPRFRIPVGASEEQVILTGPDMHASALPKETPWKFDPNNPRHNPPHITTCFDPELGCMSLAFRTGRLDLKALGQLARQVYDRCHAHGSPTTIVELGSWVGESAVSMAKAIPDGADDVLIFCVDTWEGAKTDMTGDWAKEVGKDWLQSIFRANTARYLNHRIIQREGDVDDIGRKWRGSKIDLLFLDAGHNYEEVKQSIGVWKHHMHDAGIICGHDYNNPQFPGVNQAVDEAFGEHVHHIPETYLWWVAVADLLAAPAPRLNVPLHVPV